MSENLITKKLPEGEVIPAIYDFMFTTIYNDVDNIILCENLLSMYLGIPIEEVKGKVKSLSRRLKQESKYTARKEVDLLLERGSEKINVEVSTSMSTGLVERNVILAGGVHATNYRRGNRNYRNLGSLIQINFIYDANYIIGKHFKETFYLRSKEGYVLTEKFRIDFINIAKLEEPCYTNSTDELENFCKLLIAKDKKEFKRILGEMKMEKEAKEKLEEEVMKYSRDEEVFAIYSDYTTQELEKNTVIEDRVEEQKKKLLEEQKIIIHDRVEELREKMEKERDTVIEDRVEEQKKKLLEEQKIIIHDRVEELREKMEKERDTVIEDRIEEALQEKRMEIAYILLKKNTDISLVVEVTGLTADKISKIKDNL